MSDAARRLPERPTSPHLTVWRWHATMLSSILNRATGVALYVGALIAGGWAIALARGPESYADYMGVLTAEDAVSVAHGLARTVGDESLRERIGAAASAWARREHGVGRIAELEVAAHRASVARSVDGATGTGVERRAA